MLLDSNRQDDKKENSRKRGRFVVLQNFFIEIVLSLFVLIFRSNIQIDETVPDVDTVLNVEEEIKSLKSSYIQCTQHGNMYKRLAPNTLNLVYFRALHYFRIFSCSYIYFRAFRALHRSM